jgi:hypothetical protein
MRGLCKFMGIESICMVGATDPWREFDTGRLSVFTASCASSPRRHTKVNLLLYACLQSPMWDDILLHTPSHLDDRNLTTSTEERKDGTETQGRKADVTEAWKRRRKRKGWMLQAGTAPLRHCRCTKAGTAAQRTLTLPASPHRHCRRGRGHLQYEP